MEKDTRQLRVAPTGTPPPIANQPLDEERPEVQLLTGRVRGRRKVTRDGTPYYSFLGLPYAAPPLGEQRFKAPLPAEPWEGVRDAASPGPICSQALFIPPSAIPRLSWTDLKLYAKATPHLIKAGIAVLTDSEDCLYANVYTPQLPRYDAHPRLPVLVLIHGGGFRLADGYGLYGPDYLMDAGGLVFVTFNYRLGPLGFLAVGSEEAPGNAGLKDQTMLLRWVRDNIAAFGGDPGQVTIYGESAGGVSAHLHTVSPLSRGLFQRVIASSNMLAPDWALEPRPQDHARALARLLGVADADELDGDALARELRHYSAGNIISKFSKMQSVFTPRFSIGMVFVPVVEPAHEGAFLSEDPLKLLAEGRRADVPVIVGSNSNEGLLVFLGLGDGKFGDKSRRAKRAFMKECTRQQAEVFLPRDLVSGLSGDARDALGAEVLRHYCGHDGLTLDSFDAMVEMVGDLHFVIPTMRVSRLHVATASAPTYHYFFTHRGDLGTLTDLLGLHKYQGASHGDDLGYLFRPMVCPRAGFVQHNVRDGKCRAAMVALMTNFVKTGNPTPPEWAKKHGVVWEPRSPPGVGEFRYMEIGEELAMRSGMPLPRLQFWNELYKKYLGTGLY